MNNNFIASIKIGEEWQQVFAIFPFSMGKLLDERLDEAKLTFFSNVEHYPPLSEVEIIFTSGSIHNFVLANDNSAEYPAGSGRYKHEAYLIERTKLLDGILCSSITFTNTLPSDYEMLSGKAISGGSIERSEDGGAWISLGFESSFISPIPSVLNVGQSYTLPSSREVATALAKWLNTQQSATTLSPMKEYSYRTNEYVYTESTYDGQTARWNDTLEITPQSEGEGAVEVTYQCCLDGEIGVVYGVAYKLTAQITVAPKVKPLAKYTITDCVLRALELAEPLREGENPRFTFDGVTYTDGVASQPETGSQAEKYSKIYAPEFTLTQSTLREQLKVIGSKIHAEPWLDADNVVHFLEYDSNIESESVSNETPYISKTLKTDINQYCTDIRSNAQNLVSSMSYAIGSITEPGVGLYRSLRSETKYARINEESGVIETDLPIFNIPQTPGSVMCGLLKKSGDTVSWEIDPTDITPYVFESTEYGANLSSFGGSYPYAKEYAIYYTMGERNLKGLFYKVPDALNSATYSRFAISNILAMALGSDAKDVDGKIAGGAYNLAFQVTYQPVSSAFVSHGKQAYAPSLTPYTQIYNQSENLVESDFYGQNVKGVAARLGNVEQERTYLFPDLSYIPRVGQVLKIGTAFYSISAVSSEIMPHYVKCTLGLALDFNRISEYVGINSIKRMYEVSERQTQQRQILMKEYVVINSSGVVPSDEDRLFMSTARFTTALDAIHDRGRPVTCASFRAHKKDDTEIGGQDLILPCIGRAFGNSLHFSFTLEDNYSAGSQSQYLYYDGNNSSKIEGRFQTDTPYSDVYGRAYWASLRLLTEVNPITLNYPFTIPKMNYASVVYAAATGSKKHRLRKDNREIISYNIEVEFKTEDPDLIIGSGLADYCDLVNGYSVGCVVYLTNRAPNKLMQYFTPASADLNRGNITRAGSEVTLDIFTEDFDAYKYFVICTPITVQNESALNEDGETIQQPITTGGAVLLAGSLAYGFATSGDIRSRTFYFRTTRN